MLPLGWRPFISDAAFMCDLYFMSFYGNFSRLRCLRCSSVIFLHRAISCEAGRVALKWDTNFPFILMHRVWALKGYNMFLSSLRFSRHIAPRHIVVFLMHFLIIKLCDRTGCREVVFFDSLPPLALPISALNDIFNVKIVFFSLRKLKLYVKYL